MRLFVCAVILLAGCAANPYAQEMDAFSELVASELSAGRLTQEQANYVLAKKRNELNERRSAVDAGDASIIGTYQMMRRR